LCYDYDYYYYYYLLFKYMLYLHNLILPTIEKDFVGRSKFSALEINLKAGTNTVDISGRSQYFSIGQLRLRHKVRRKKTVFCGFQRFFFDLSCFVFGCGQTNGPSNWKDLSILAPSGACGGLGGAPPPTTKPGNKKLVANFGIWKNSDNTNNNNNNNNNNNDNELIAPTPPPTPVPPTPPPTTPPPGTTGVIGFRLANADSDALLQTIVGGAQIARPLFGVTFVAIVAGSVSSVQLSISVPGQPLETRTEGVPPFSAFGDIDGDFAPHAPVLGTYTCTCR
jgi:hypothetical protein